MNAPSALATRWSTAFPTVDEADEMNLAALLELFGHEDEPHDEFHDDAPWQNPVPAVRAWTQQWLQRATAWGAGPEGSWRAW